MLLFVRFLHKNSEPYRGPAAPTGHQPLQAAQVAGGRRIVRGTRPVLRQRGPRQPRILHQVAHTGELARSGGMVDCSGPKRVPHAGMQHLLRLQYFEGLKVPLACSQQGSLHHHDAAPTLTDGSKRVPVGPLANSLRAVSHCMCMRRSFGSTDSSLSHEMTPT